MLLLPNAWQNCLLNSYAEHSDTRGSAPGAWCSSGHAQRAGCPQDHPDLLPLKSYWPRTQGLLAAFYRRFLPTKPVLEVIGGFSNKTSPTERLTQQVFISDRSQG